MRILLLTREQKTSIWEYYNLQENRKPQYENTITYKRTSTSIWEYYYLQENRKPQYENTITYKRTENLNMRTLLLTREQKTSIWGYYYLQENRKPQYENTITYKRTENLHPPRPLHLSFFFSPITNRKITEKVAQATWLYSVQNRLYISFIYWIILTNYNFSVSIILLFHAYVSVLFYWFQQWSLIPLLLLLPLLYRCIFVTCINKAFSTKKKTLHN